MKQESNGTVRAAAQQAPEREKQDRGYQPGIMDQHAGIEHFQSRLFEHAN
jgi:hypothetical protein